MQRDRTTAGCHDRNTIYTRIESVLGRDTTLRLLDHLGGRLIYVRLTPGGGPTDLVSTAIGLDDSRRLSARFGGERLSLPVRNSPCRGSVARTARIRALATTGVNAATIAVTIGCSQRWVNFILNGK